MSDKSGVRRRRGEPLTALVLLIAGWTGARMMMWESPFETALPFAERLPGASRHTSLPDAPAPTSIDAAVDDLVKPRSIIETMAVVAPVAPRNGPSLASLTAAYPFGQALPGGTALALNQADLARTSGISPVIVQPGPPPPQQRERRWHLAAWAAWRAGSGLPQFANGARPASYGGTQVGALTQLDLAGGSRRPAVHLRTTYAPDRPSQAEVALGAGLRPFGDVPVRLLAEVRGTRGAGRTEVRPAVLAVTELAPVSLPMGFSGDGYAQAGWVGGQFETAFVDGQARITRPLLQAGRAKVRVGVGAWGGAQKFAERIDVGPTASLELAPVRLSIDYRAKVAGNASPGDGVALTLSTGF